MNKKLEQLLLYVGTAGAIVSSLAYIIIITVLVIGVEAEMDTAQLLIVSIIGGVAGLLIIGMLRSQGKMFAEKEPESERIMNLYYKAINKSKPKKKLRTIKSFIFWSTVKDVFSKGLTIGMTIYFSVTIFMKGNGDFSLIGLAISNIFMFLSFGVMAMRKSYMFYLNEHLPAIIQITKNIEQEVEDGKLKNKLQEQEVLNCAGTSTKE